MPGPRFARLVPSLPAGLIAVALALGLTAGVRSAAPERVRAEHAVAAALARAESIPVRPKPRRLVPVRETTGREEAELVREAPPLPAPEQVAAARRFAESRQGNVSFAVVDTDGSLRCHRCRERYATASVVKAMLLVAYLGRVGREGRQLSVEERGLLAPMIRYSDNRAADVVYGRLGDAPLFELAERARMKGFSVRGHWGNALTTAADQARFFARLDRLTPRPHRRYARALLSSVIPEQAWGVAESARPRWRPLTKGGWTPSRRGYIAHQAGRLEQRGRRLALAILTDGNAGHADGVETVRGIAAALLERGG